MNSSENNGKHISCDYSLYGRFQRDIKQGFITYLYSMSFSSGYLPDELKIGNCKTNTKAMNVMVLT